MASAGGRPVASIQAGMLPSGLSAMVRSSALSADSLRAPRSGSARRQQLPAGGVIEQKSNRSNAVSSVGRSRQGSTLYHYRGRNLSYYEIFGPGCTSAAVLLKTFAQAENRRVHTPPGRRCLSRSAAMARSRRRMADVLYGLKEPSDLVVQQLHSRPWPAARVGQAVRK